MVLLPPSDGTAAQVVHGLLHPAEVVAHGIAAQGPILRGTVLRCSRGTVS